MKVINKEMPREFKEVEIYGLGDTHIGETHQDKKRIKQFMEEILAQPNRYVIVNGDIVNMATRTSVSDVYSEVCTPDEAINKAVELLEPIKDRILVIADGNHERRAYRESGIKVLSRVSRELGIPECYAEFSYLIFISFGKNRGRDIRKTVYSLYGRHGSGGGVTVGGKANKLKKMDQVIDSDIYIVNHTHQSIAFREGFYRIDYRNRKVKHTEKLFVNSVAFLNWGGYAEDNAFTPSSTIYNKIILQGEYRFAQCLV